MDEFVHLHVHSEYSLLDGLSSCQELAERAAELGMPAIALTDHGGMYGAVQFFSACKAAEIKPVIGMEAYIARAGRRDRDPQRDRHAYHIELLAMNDAGYKNLMCLATIAQLEGFYYRPRIDKEALSEHSEGLIVLSGCGSSEISRLILAGRREQARKTIEWYRDLFPGRYFLELQDHGIAELDRVNAQVIGLSRELDLPLVATNDVHYARKEQAEIQDVMLCIGTGKTVNEQRRMRMDGETYYMRSAAEMAELFGETPEALANTLRIAEMCNVELDFGTYHLPPFDVPDGHDAQSYLRVLCEAGFAQRYPDAGGQERERLEYELDIIHRMGFDTYFLIVWDLCRFSRDQGIWYNVRGSGNSSIVAYSLGITFLEPLRHGLIFERFLNLGRVTMPDIDLDFPDDQRADLIRYTAEKYGRDHVAQIITFGTLGAKAAIRDVGRALDYPLPEVDRLARLVPGGPKVKLSQALESVPELSELYEEEPHIRRLLDTARGVEGHLRHASTHAAGVIISDVPLVEYVPLSRPTRGGSGEGDIGVVTQYTGDELEHLGLLKVDYLGLSTLTVMRRACALIGERQGIELNLDTIPIEDPIAFELLSRGDVMGLFQVEGQGMRRVLMSMQPTEFDHVMATISLFRPGPMEYIDDYIDRMHERKKVEYLSDELEPVLKETYGIIVYQEQIIRILTDVAGYTAGDADLVRRAVSKKKKTELLKHKGAFVKGATGHSAVPAEVAQQIFEDIEYFARYGFNKSHAADYAVLTCQTAYLKATYPVEYMTALLSVERNNTDKVGRLIAECRRMSIEVLPPDVNQSGLDFTIEDGQRERPAIRFGLGAIKNVGEGPVEAILESREHGGPFGDLDDFCERVDLRQVNRRALESMIKVGALKAFGNRSRLLGAAERIIGLSAGNHRAQDAGQMSLFGDSTGVHLAATDSLLPHMSDVSEVPQSEILEWEKELVGVYISEHPMEKALRDLEDVVSTSIGALGDSRQGQQVVIAGMTQRVRRHMTKTGKEMAFVTLEDLDATCDVVVFPRVWERTKELWAPETVVVVCGKIDSQRRDSFSLLCDWAKSAHEVSRPSRGNGGQRIPDPTPPPPPEPQPPWDADDASWGRPGPVKGKQIRTVRVTLTRSGKHSLDIGMLRSVRDLLVQERGEDTFVIHLVGGGTKPVELAFPNDRIRYTAEVAEQLSGIVGSDSIQLLTT